MRGDTLVWMPAHQSIATVGEAKLSNGARLTMLDWRANRLEDVLAKRAAAVRAPPVAVARILRWAQAAVRHHAMLLARVTHAANHCEILETMPDGSVVKRILRDSVEAPRRERSCRPPDGHLPPTLPVAAVAKLRFLLFCYCLLLLSSLTRLLLQLNLAFSRNSGTST